MGRSPRFRNHEGDPLADFTPGTYSAKGTYTDAAEGERVVFTGQSCLDTKSPLCGTSYGNLA